MSLTKKYLINGPNNVVRLTDGNKILYIFGDIHLEPIKQTQCALDNNYPSIDIDVLLFEFMKLNKEKQFDLFIEDWSSKFKQTYNTTNNRDKYILKVKNIFTDSLIENKNEIKINPKYPKFRFHNMDIRNDKILLYSLIIFDYNINRNYIDFDYFLYKIYEFEKLVSLSFEDTEKNNIDVNKILNKYSNNTIKKKINDLYQNLYVKNYKLILKMFHDTRTVLLKSKKLTEKIITNYFNMWNKIYYYNLYNIALLTDLYFIRRFLDKNYIKNSILYTGQYHLVDISYILIKYFNFKITNIFYNPNNINFNKQFLKTDYTIEYIMEICNKIENRTKDKQIYQCINLFDFPDNFN